MKTQRENELLINIRRILVDYYKEGSYTLDKAESDMLNLFASSQQVSREKIIDILNEHSTCNLKLSSKSFIFDSIASALTDTGGEDKVTDEIIEKWAYLFEESELPFEEQNDGTLLRRCKNYVNGLIIGARAMKNGLIKPTYE
jgi:hypothetical protein